jgi:hypothetical protein
MKYSLRSLMIVVTLVCVCAGIVVPWQKHRQLCLERAQLHSSKIIESMVLAGSFHSRPGTPEHKARWSGRWRHVGKVTRNIGDWNRNT